MDVAWGPLFVLVTGVATWQGSGDIGRVLLVLLLVSVWAFRLALHIGRRNQAEDPRYAAWRETYGRHWWWRSLFQVFLLQALLLSVIAQPLLWSVTYQGRSPGLTWIDGIGVAVFVTGLLIEAIADRQLARHVADEATRGTLLQTGLWARSRHPNYFGEALLWWGLGIIALNIPGGWITLVGPLLLTYLLRFVSGVPMTEARMATKPGWAEYAAKTPAFVPRLLKR